MHDDIKLRQRPAVPHVEPEITIEELEQKADLHIIDPTHSNERRKEIREARLMLVDLAKLSLELAKGACSEDVCS